MIQYFDDRFYFHPEEKKYVASVTTIDSYVINKPQLNRWRGDLGNELADLRSAMAARSGKNVHALMERYCNGEEIKYDRNAITQDEWIKVWRGVKIIEELKPKRIMAIEKTVFGDGYAGTVDLVLYIRAGSYSVGQKTPIVLNEGAFICDWKSGSYVGDSADRQVSAYAKAYERVGIVPSGALIFHLGGKTKSGYSVKLLKGKELDDSYADFCSIKDVFYRLYPNLTAEELEMPETFKRS